MSEDQDAATRPEGKDEGEASPPVEQEEADEKNGTTEQYSTRELPSVDDAAEQVRQRFQDAMAKQYSNASVKKDEAEETTARQDFNGELSSVSQETSPLLIHDDGNPESPGCFIRMPSGCPTQNTTGLWRHDVQAEQENLTAAQCYVRKPDWETYCGVDDVQMVYVSLTQTGARVASTAKDSASAEDSKEEPTAAEDSTDEPASESEDVDGANPPGDEDAVKSAGEKDSSAEKHSDEELPSVSEEGTAEKYSNKELPSVSEDTTAEKYSNQELPSVNEDATAARFSDRELPAVGEEERAEIEEQARLEREKEKLKELLERGPGERFENLRDSQLKIHEALREKRLRGDGTNSKHSMKELPYVDQEGEGGHAPAATYSEKELPSVDQENGEAATASYSTEGLPPVNREAVHVAHSDEGLPAVDKAAQKAVDVHRQPPGIPKAEAGDLEDDMEWDSPGKATPADLGPAEAPARPHAVGGTEPGGVPQDAPAPVGPELGPGLEDVEPPKAGDAPLETPVDPALKELWEAKDAHLSEREAKEAYKRIRASRAAQEQSQELARVWDPEMNLMLLGLAIWILGCVGISELRRVGQLKSAPKR